MRKQSTASRFAERELHGFDDAGSEERIVVWIERMQGGTWAVGRAVNPQYRPSDEPRRDDYVFEGHELEDVLEQANGILDDDARVSEDDGRPEHIRPFTRKELLGPLERWFFGRRRRRRVRVERQARRGAEREGRWKDRGDAQLDHVRPRDA